MRIYLSVLVVCHSGCQLVNLSVDEAVSAIQFQAANWLTFDVRWFSRVRAAGSQDSRIIEIRQVVRPLLREKGTLNRYTK